jgi:hypothetical protein
MVVFEVMTENLDRQWWNSYRQNLETCFRQDQLLIRAQVIEII